MACELRVWARKLIDRKSRKVGSSVSSVCLPTVMIQIWLVVAEKNGCTVAKRHDARGWIKTGRMV